MKSVPTLEPVSQVACYALYVVRGGRRDGWFVAKRWIGAEDAMFTYPKCNAEIRPENLPYLTYPLQYEGIAKEIGQ
jgi:hypothetical protein